MSEDKSPESQKSPESPQMENSIAISSATMFKGQIASHGFVYFIATWKKWVKFNGGKSLQEFKEAYLVSNDNIKLHGRPLCEKSVINQVIARHFTDNNG